MLDKFVTLREEELSSGLERNILVHRNEVSPFFDFIPQRCEPSGEVFVDEMYGQAFDSWIAEAKGIYGKTDRLPTFSGDALANLGFLRVPYRRIPRRLVRNRAELDAIVSSIRPSDPDLQVLFRGQGREYSLGRSPKTLEILYGDAEALEPSLLPSASRRNVVLEDILPEWSWLIKIYFHTQKDLLDPKDVSWLQNEYYFSLFALALAQHYGLPSAGLDVTTNLEAALFFALTDFRGVEGENVDIGYRPRKRTELAVIYVLVPRERFELNYDSFAPRGLPKMRPEAQAAHFLHTGWGLNKNACARHLFLALYLDPRGDFGAIPSVEELYPVEDPFAKFIQWSLSFDLPANLRSFLSYFRWVIPLQRPS